MISPGPELAAQENAVERGGDEWNNPFPIVTVLIPVLGRPARARPVAQSIFDSAPHAGVMFICTPQDWDEIDACHAAYDIGNNVVEVVDFEAGPGDYAKKINHGISINRSPWIFQGADDLEFKPGWWDACMRARANTGAAVIGTNDLCNPRTMGGKHSTHSLVLRSWIEEVGPEAPGVLLHEGYWHNFVDDELVQIARFLHTFAWAGDAQVQHLHPNCGEVETDETYELALDRLQFSADRRIMQRRKVVWRRKFTQARRRR